jgi:hypothetical protein
MRNRLMMATAALALVVGASTVLAQQERGGAAEKSAPNAQRSSPAPKAGAMHNGAAEKAEPGRSERSEPNRPQAQENRGRSETTGQAPSSREQGREDKPEGRDDKRQTTGQANERRDQTRDNDQKRTEGQAQEKRENEKSERTNVREDQQGGRRETTGQGAASGRSSSTNISVENRTKIHDTIIKERSAPRVEHVDFNVSVGTVVPRNVRLVTVPSTIVSIEPSWRGYEYFLVGDQIVIVNPRSMEIVAVLDA